VEDARSAGIDVLVGVGPRMTSAALGLGAEPLGRLQVLCDSAETACGALDGILAPGDTVLVKGSRGVRLDHVVAHVQGRHKKAAAVA
jgi:UDP-N-acetylmuramoyl-tripeptide--D-alanyl-D-alanine ligase